MDKKSKFQLMEEKLLKKEKSAWRKLNEKDVMKFSENYKTFLSISKTERLASKNIKELLEKNGFRNIEKMKSLHSGDKVYKHVKAKTLIAFIVGKKPEELRIIGSHVDSPRLDLKPSPLTEDANIAMLKTHYYGGIKKYHWVNHPLSLHGIIYTKKGKEIEIHIGDKENEPKFIIPDLLPHLAKKQMEKDTKSVIEGEELNILVGNIPVDDEKIKQQVKLNVLSIMNTSYGIEEEDFNFAELELVPAGMPMDIGFDKSLVAAYGQDDKVCAYTSLRALLEQKKPEHTTVGFFADKEEIGSMGNTGAESLVLNNFAFDYANLLNLKIPATRILERAKSISADVTAGVNPNYKDVHDMQNASFIGNGVSVEKYGGSGGKYMSNDAHAEYLQFIRTILDKENIPWQTGELGKVDLGGGGTIAMFMSRYGMDCVDVGPCVLGMHSPTELASKADIYSAYKLYGAFFRS